LTTTNTPINGTPLTGRLARPPEGYWENAWRRFRADKVSVIASVVFLIICLISFGSPLLSRYVTRYDPNRVNLDENYQAPNWRHLFGTDEYGRDYLTRTIHAGRVSLTIAFAVTLINLSIGVLLGLGGGFYGGKVDDVLQNIIFVMITIPRLYLLIILGAFIKWDMWSLAFFLGITSWMGASRQVRGLVLSVKQRDYVLAARCLGATNWRIMWRHILPNVLSVVLVIVGSDIAGAIFIESSLSFLGFGVAPPTATWGNMLSNALAYTFRNPWLVVFPGMMIAITTLCVLLLADGLRDAFDPRLR
jgi:peptide/nickel transport system permease protein